MCSTFTSLIVVLFAQVAGTVRAGETGTQCDNPHQVASVAQAVTGACQDAEGSIGLPEHCAAECAAVFLPWFDDAQGTCFRALHLDEHTEQTFAAFASVCNSENSGVDMSGAIFIRPSDSQNTTLICFEAACDAAPILQHRGAIVVEGCEAGAPLGSLCRLGCRAGFEISAAEDGHCTLAEVGSLAVYSGQSVTCSPETERNGQMSESYCRMAATEAMLDCCELENMEGVVCAADVPPTTCVVECAEIWEPLVEDCEQHLQDFQQLTAECAEVADSFLARAPSSLTVAGLQCTSDANGAYQVADTIGGKPHWVMMDSFGNVMFHLYAVDEPFEAWVIGMSVHDHSVQVISFESEPPWGPHVWRENCGTAIGVTDVLLTITPSFSDHDCHEAIVLMNAELTAYCFDPEDLSVDFQASLDAEEGPTNCEYDCAHLWYLYSEECNDFLLRQHPYLARFTELCFVTYERMVVKDEDGYLDAGAQDDHTFRAQQGLVYSVEEEPGEGLLRTDLAIETPHSHHVLADRMDVTKRGAGVHRLEWDAPETESGMDLAVTALEGSGTYHLRADIVGTAERLAKEAILGREVLLQIEQQWFDDAEFRYSGMHMRADGASFLLKFAAGAGLSYQFSAVLNAESAAAHLRLAIFPPEAIGTASSTGTATESSCQLPPAAQGLQSTDVVEMAFGIWAAPQHGQTWGEQHRCADLTRVGPPERGGCDGEYRYFAGQSFPTNHTWDWTAPFTAQYMLQITANCDVTFYDDPSQPGCAINADGIECEDDSVTRCLSTIGLTIRTIDRSVHVKHTFDVPVTQEVLNSIELQQQMADMFALQQQPAIVFPLSITPLDCELAENAERPSCQQVVDPGPGGGHRRRRLQTQIGADTDHTCPRSSFDTQDTAMRAACGFQSSDAANPFLQGQCPSLECARSVLPLLDNCAEHIAEFARHIGPEAAFYEALERSEMFADCQEMEQAAAQFASVQVEFRAPTLEVAEQMIAEHQQMVSEMFLPTSESVGRQHLCFGNPDASVGDGSGCGGRRQLDGEEIGVDVCAAKDEKIRQLEAELEKSRAETQAAVLRSAEKDQVIEQQTKVIERQAKTIEKQATENAFYQRLHRLRQNAFITQKVSDPTRRNQTAVGRRTQALGSGESALLRSARVGVARSVKACAVHPCELSDGICQNGGTCVEEVAEGGGAVPFECQCTPGFGGDRCEATLHPSSPTFADSNIITGTNRDAWEAHLHAWLGESKGDSEWALCYSSFLHPTDSASEFHSRCDAHSETLSVGTNQAGGVQRTFGGYAEHSWSVERCCLLNECSGVPVDDCVDSTATSNFIFRLGPRDSTKYDPVFTEQEWLAQGHSVAPFQYTYHNTAGDMYWPTWGSDGDLSFGSYHPLGSADDNQRLCRRSSFFGTAADEVCGGNNNWGETQLEVWYRVPPPLPDPNSDAFLQAQPEIAAHGWVRCFDSDVDDATTPVVFHENCDVFEETVTIAGNELGYTFGGYAEHSWSSDACCLDGANQCYPTSCVDQTAAANFIFGLAPGAPERFDYSGTAIGIHRYQQANPAYWPTWGQSGDLWIGRDGAPGAMGFCTQGGTYAGAPDQICGGGYDIGGGGPCTGLGCWGETRLVVWRIAPVMPSFTVNSGPCTLAEGGRCVGRWPGGYGPNENCAITVVGGGGGGGGDGAAGGVLGACPVFDTSTWSGSGDHLTLPDGSTHNGADCPVGAVLAAGQTLTWHSNCCYQGDNGNGLPQTVYGPGDPEHPYNEPVGFSCGPGCSYWGLAGGWQICFI